MFFIERKPFCNVLAVKTPHRTIFISNYKNIITRCLLKNYSGQMRTFQLFSKVMQKGSKGSVILLGLLPCTEGLHQTFTIDIPCSTLTTGTLLFSSGSLFYWQLLTCFFHVHQYFQIDFVDTGKFLEYSSSACRGIPCSSHTSVLHKNCSSCQAGVALMLILSKI